MKTNSKVWIQVFFVTIMAFGALILGVHALTAAAQTSNTLYVIDGGTLSSTAGGGAATDTIASAGGGNFDGTPHSQLTYTSGAITGTYNSQSTQFSLYLDSLTAVANGVQARVSYDFTGDGTYDRIETYNYFPTDPVNGYELYSQGQGLKSSSGAFANLNNGRVKVEVWNAIGNNTSLIRTSATSANGQQSKVTIPFTIGASGPTATFTRTPTLGGPTATRTRTPTVGGPTPTFTRTPTPGSGTPFWDTANIPVARNVMTFKFLNRTNGKYPDSQVYWSFNGQTHSIAEQPTFDMPANSAGRMYFYLGSPTSQYNDFIEFTIGPAVFNGNTTRVDWFGVKLAMRLHAADGYDASVGEDLTTFQEDRAVTFQKFINEVPAEFDHLAQIQAPYRIPAPGKMGDTAFTPSGQYANYFASYASSVGVSASVFDIMACAGSLANNAAMCSALNRHVAHLPQSQWSTSSLYYQAAPANYYAKFWHTHSIGGLAYGFPYDDYAGYSSFISHNNPQWLLVAIGW